MELLAARSRNVRSRCASRPLTQLRFWSKTFGGQSVTRAVPPSYPDALPQSQANSREQDARTPILTKRRCFSVVFSSSSFHLRLGGFTVVFDLRQFFDGSINHRSIGQNFFCPRFAVSSIRSRDNRGNARRSTKNLSQPPALSQSPLWPTVTRSFQFFFASVFLS